MKTIKFLYSYGGKIVPRPIDGKLRYAGGHTRVLSVDRSITYSELMVKFGESCGSSMNLKCKLPNDDLDLLVTIKSDEELRAVIEDYESASSPVAKIRAVLFPVRSAKKASDPSSPMSCFDFPSSTKPRVIAPPSPAVYAASRAAVKRRSYPAKKASPPSSPMSCLDFPSASKACVSFSPSAEVYCASPPRAVVRRFSYPTLGYPVLAGKSRYCQDRSPMHFYHVPHRNYSH
ncbi:hypothetical protein PHJA_001220400 [Phtheirospermum japonicum]|uniref:PB1 domain-containing protein n=1 Tax=Phtheirospermum japonicum TaxID=374723 RepID=A0A830C5X8_9LAMI|nr:hypothetical protein PHJA_001220400 [Phtheirospermum japonicum]